MGIALSQYLDVHAKAIALRTQRAEVLAANLAHQNTPGYQARDLDFRASMAAAMNEAAEAMLTDKDAIGQEARPKPTAGYRVPFNPRQDGNTVELSVEQAQFAQNAIALQASLNFAYFGFKGVAKAISG